MNANLLHELYAPSDVSPPNDVLLDASVIDQPAANVDEHSLLGLLELLLKNPTRLDELARDEQRQPELVPRFLAIVLISFSTFALALVLLLNHAERIALPTILRASWTGGVGPALSLWLAYTLGMVAASGVCLPSFYFFGLLVGVRTSVLQVTGHVMKGKASTAVMLLGILPIYVAIVLGMVVFHAPLEELRAALYLGLALPFIAGLWGVWSIYRGFLGLADTLPEARRCRRTCFLRRLTVAWAACYTVVTPVMIYTLWDYFAKHLA
jgi:hypothetical protein